MTGLWRLGQLQLAASLAGYGGDLSVQAGPGPRHRNKGQSAYSSNSKGSREALASWWEAQTGGIKACPILQSWEELRLGFLSAISWT